MDKVARVIITLTLTLALSGPTWAEKNAIEKRQEIRQERDDLLEDLTQRYVGLRYTLKDAAGYAVFSNVGLNFVFASFGSGYGVVVDNQSGEETFMKMGSAGIGLGLGVKDFRALFVFKSREKLEQFIERGWEIGAAADAAARNQETGGPRATAAAAVYPGVDVYQVTDAGVALQATLQGTKYWVSEELNQG